MAVTLPPIGGKPGNAPSYHEQTLHGPKKSSTKGLADFLPTAEPRAGCRKERELYEKRMQLRSLQRPLTKSETCQYRYSYKHNLCMDMLREGFHLSFKELFELIHRQNMERLAAGPESFVWNQIMLQDEHDKLDILKRYLTTAEAALRKGDFAAVYEARYELANYFQQCKDKWLADHFFKMCLDIALSIDSDGGRTKAQSHCNFGVCEEENGDLYSAGEHFESYYELSRGHTEDWLKEDLKRGHISYLTDACVHLYRIYTVIGNQLEKEDDMKLCVKYHIKALEKAKESGNKKLEGEASYRLGLTHELLGNMDTALVHLNSFYNSCKITKDKEGLGRACDAIAKTYARMGVKDQSIEYLKEFVETAESTGMDAELAQACHNLGNIYNSLGNYKEAGEYFNRAYNISRAMGDAESIQVNRVQSGIAQAHAMLNVFSTVVVRASGSRDYLDRVIDWKSIRANIYESKAERIGKTAATDPPSQRAPAPKVEEKPAEEVAEQPQGEQQD